MKPDIAGICQILGQHGCFAVSDRADDAADFIVSVHFGGSGGKAVGYISIGYADNSPGMGISVCCHNQVVCHGSLVGRTGDGTCGTDKSDNASYICRAAGNIAFIDTVCDGSNSVSDQAANIPSTAGHGSFVDTGIDLCVVFRAFCQRAEAGCVGRKRSCGN